MRDRLHLSMRHWYRLVGAASPGARTIERDGVVAALVPTARERAVANAVVYEHADGLAAAYDEVAAAYEELGANWTVWVHHGDARAAALLERAGHFLDSEPEGMGLDLRDGTERPPADALADWTASGDPGEVGPVNDRSYTFGTDSFTRVFAGLPPEATRIYLAQRDGEAVACVQMVDAPPNTEVQMVAVVPEARGQGLAGKLLGHALADAAERGLETSTLISTELGRPTYERLGFQPLGALQMWERRVGQR